MTPDGLIRWYYETVADCGAPGLDIVDSRGRVYGKKCEHCPSVHRHSKKDGEWVCGRCGADWPYDDRFLLKGEVSRQARVRGDRVSSVPQRSAGGSERRISRRVDIGVLLDAFMRECRPGARYYVSNALGYSIRELAAEAHLAWAGYPELSRSEIGRLIGAARLEWSTRVEVAGLLPKP